MQELFVYSHFDAFIALSINDYPEGEAFMYF